MPPPSARGRSRRSPKRPLPTTARVTAAITMMGKDRTGVVARVTQSLFESGANIESLEEQVSRGLFSMSILASWPAAAAAGSGSMERRVVALGRSLGMETRVRFHREGGPQRMAVLVTKEAHCLEGVLRRYGPGAPGARRGGAVVALVVGSRKDLAPLTRRGGVPFHHVPFGDRARAERALLKLLDRYDVDFLVLARFMKILSPDLCWRFRNKIINIHPSLLPAFPGATAYRQAYEKGVRVVGVTAHFVTPDLDQGPIIMQDAFHVRPEDPLERIKDRGRALETRVLLEAIDLYLRKRLDVHWGRVWTG